MANRQNSKQLSKELKFQVELIDNYIQDLDWQVKENANMSYSLQGMRNYVNNEITKVYWLEKVYSEKVKNAHISRDLHIHDLGELDVYCVGWDLYDLLVSGFRGVSGKVESSPAKHFRTALGQIVNFMYTLQGEAAGAQAFSSFDTLLAPFIAYDNLSYKEVKQAMQEFVYNMNIPTRVGFQTPFTNLTMDLTPSPSFAKQAVIIGGEIKDRTYGEFQKEMDMLNKAFLEVMIEGDANGRVFSFPIPTYNITKDFDWEHENVGLLWESAAKYGIPYFSNFINSDMDPEDARSMCCRLRIDNRQLDMKGGGLFGAHPLTGSVGIVTINLPRIGYLSTTETEFYGKLEELMEIAKESLETKRSFLEEQTEKGMYPYSKYYLGKIKQRFGSYWKNHFSTIGILGMNEAILNLSGKDISTVEGKKFAEEVLDYMREKLVDYQKETGNNYNLEASPAEGTSYRLALADREKFGDKIFFSNDYDVKYHGAEPYYTNSSQLPVQHTEDIFEELDLQDSLQSKYTGGTVVHLFLGERISDPRSVKNLVRKICENYSLPYFTLSPTFSICSNHGYIPGEHFACPKCGAESEVYSRIVGYLRPVKQWNNGKQEEFKTRKTFKLVTERKEKIEKEIQAKLWE